jgi:catechol 2,3-dioxygenase-like lactoylglutathione lyase family enzyme
MRALVFAGAMLAGTSAMADGIPTLRGGDHVGITVPDLAEAVDFFKDVIGCAEFYPLGPFRADEGTWMQDHLNVHPRAVIEAMRLMRCGYGLDIELFQYSAPEQAKAPPRNSDIGGHHIAFYVDDMTAAVEYLRKRGVRVLGEPTTMTEGPSAGETWVYFLAPWGLQLELVSYPDGKAYAKDRPDRLWSATAPGS